MVVAMNLWGGLTAKREINYESLSGLAKEAGEYAVRGEIPNTSKDGLSMGVFAGGCFWGLELAYQRVPGVVETCVGYSQGTVEKPTYDEVCSATTGHTEAVMVTYDPEVVSFDALCDVFWSRLGGDAVRYHQVGNDRGPQYRHGIYTNTPEQLDVARKSLVERQKSFNRKITTEVEPVGVFWPAENYHQQYLEKGGRFNSPQSAEKGATDPIRCYG
ncbi:hypothetical protein CTAYLR_006075 [Chrysophaeum taylorii]|uniref:peptide-methionine (S)-S-oxide reductase n=1 Tax=Chrysophaeum taylorii TaxID=2483200 RepID=A0AAD7UJD5_9STRA|nr:hypothetical protein CTAYLR_006075 [Chrysophaeum taylorii]